MPRLKMREVNFYFCCFEIGSCPINHTDSSLWYEAEFNMVTKAVRSETDCLPFISKFKNVWNFAFTSSMHLKARGC
jgi:hypothetical protein